MVNVNGESTRPNTLKGGHRAACCRIVKVSCARAARFGVHALGCCSTEWFRVQQRIAQLLALALLLPCTACLAAELPLVTNVDWQPFTAQIKRVIEATDSLGSPFT